MLIFATHEKKKKTAIFSLYLVRIFFQFHLVSIIAIVYVGTAVMKVRCLKKKKNRASLLTLESLKAKYRLCLRQRRQESVSPVF